MKDETITDEKLPAQDALELGIIDRVVPQNKLEETALQVAENFAATKMRSLVGIKRLINYSMKDLKDYLNFENQELMRFIGNL